MQTTCKEKGTNKRGYHAYIHCYDYYMFGITTTSIPAAFRKQDSRKQEALLRSLQDTTLIDSAVARDKASVYEIRTSKGSSETVTIEMEHVCKPKIRGESLS